MGEAPHPLRPPAPDGTAPQAQHRGRPAASRGSPGGRGTGAAHSLHRRRQPSPPPSPLTAGPAPPYRHGDALDPPRPAGQPMAPPRPRHVRGTPSPAGGARGRRGQYPQCLAGGRCRRRCRRRSRSAPVRQVARAPPSPAGLLPGDAACPGPGRCPGPALGLAAARGLAA